MKEKTDLIKAGPSELPVKQPTLKDMAAHFLDLGTVNLKPDTKRSYQNGLKRFFDYLETKGIDSPEMKTVKEFKDNLQEKGYSVSTINGTLTAVRVFFDYLEMEYGQPNIARRIRGLKQSEMFLREPATSDQIQAMLALPDRSTIRGKRDYALIRLIFYAGGMRVSEVAKANLEDLKPISEGEAWLWYQGKGRDMKDKRKFVPKITLQALREYLNCRQMKPKSPLFTSLSGRNQDGRLSTRSISGIVKSHFRMIGIDDPRITCHSLRHSFVTEGRRAGIPVDALRDAVGHESDAAIRKYDHYLNRERDAAERALEDSLGF